MSSTFMTIYVLIWPVLAAGVGVVLCVGLARDIRAARKSGKSMV